MTHSLEQKAEHETSQKDELQKRRMQGLEIVCSLEAAVRSDVTKWNELNPGYRRKIDGVFRTLPTGAFQVRKESFPPATVDVTLTADAWSILVKRNSLRPEGGAPQINRDQFELKPDVQGSLVLALRSGDRLS